MKHEHAAVTNMKASLMPDLEARPTAVWSPFDAPSPLPGHDITRLLKGTYDQPGFETYAAAEERLKLVADPRRDGSSRTLNAAARIGACQRHRRCFLSAASTASRLLIYEHIRLGLLKAAKQTTAPLCCVSMLKNGFALSVRGEERETIWRLSTDRDR
jgi:hypothetical protein